MLKKLIHKKSLAIILIFTLLLVSINSIVSNIIQHKISDLLVKENSKYYVTTVEEVHFKALKRSIVLNNVFLSPTSKSFSNLKNKKTKNPNLQKIQISSLELNGIHLLKILFKNKIEINNLIINNLLFQEFKNSKIKSPPKKDLNIDSIYIKNINGFKINKINVNNLIFQITDVSTNKISFQNKPVSFNLTGFELEEYKDDYFRLFPLNNKFEIDKINIDFPDKKYNFSMEAVTVEFEKDIVNIKNLSYNPLIKRTDLSNTYKFNTAIFNVKVEDVKLYNFSIGKLIANKGLFIDSISIFNLDLKIYKDKRKPFDLEKRPTLPHLALKQMKTPLLIQKIKISNSNILFEQRLEKGDLLMTVSLDKLNANISNISSIKKYRESPLKVHLTSKLMNSSNMKIDITMPLKNGQDMFYFNGSLSPTKFKYFDSVIVPAIGIKILQGDLDHLSFSASANSTSSNGKMTLLYHDLEAEVFKSKSNEENKFLSWTVNHVVHTSNPNKKGHKREAIMHTERVIYKGYINYLWKTIQSGITNTIAPMGKTTDKAKAKNERKAKRQHKKNKN